MKFSLFGYGHSILCHMIETLKKSALAKPILITYRITLLENH